MANPVSSLREANNYVEIEGFLEENNLEKKVLDEGTDKERKIIAGNLVIGVSEEAKYKVEFFANEKNANGDESKLYKGLETVINEYVSRAQALNNNLGEDAISKVNIKGAKLTINDYWDEDKQTMYTTVRLRASFVNRVTAEFKPKATFDVEAYFESIEKEVVDGAETGRVKADCIIPVYNGAVIPVTFYTTEDKTYGDIGAYLLEHYSTGKSAPIGGSIRCIAKTNTTTVAGFGAPVERTFTNYVYEYIIERGAAEQYLITDPKNFDKNTIKSAMQYRNEQLEQKKASGSSNINTTTATGFGNTPVSNKTKELDF